MLALLTIIATGLPVALSCIGLQDAVITTTTTAANTTLAQTIKTPWVRCKIASSAVCRATKCGTGETQLASFGGVAYENEAACMVSTLYEQCYDFSIDGSGNGICQPDYVGCTGTNKKVLASTFNDRTCGSFSSQYYAKCINKANPNAISYRPEKSRCSTAENWNPLNVLMPLSDCFVNTYSYCASGNTASCKPSIPGCLATEVTGPAVYTSKSLCDSLGTTPLYDLCYDFNDPITSNYGKCQLSLFGCSGMKTWLISGVPDFTCGANQRDPSLINYIRCQEAGTLINKCRPLDAGTCKPDGTEARVPTITDSFPSLDLCGIYQWCYNFAQTEPSSLGTCRLQGTCTAIEKAIGTADEGDTCDAATVSNTYVRCVSSASTTAKCRPLEAACLTTGTPPETQNPATNLALTDCIEYKLWLCASASDSSYGCKCTQNPQVDCVQSTNFITTSNYATPLCSAFCPATVTYIKCRLQSPGGSSITICTTSAACTAGNADGYTGTTVGTAVATIALCNASA